MSHKDDSHGTTFKNRAPYHTQETQHKEKEIELEMDIIDELEIKIRDVVVEAERNGFAYDDAEAGDYTALNAAELKAPKAKLHAQLATLDLGKNESSTTNLTLFGSSNMAPTLKVETQGDKKRAALQNEKQKATHIMATIESSGDIGVALAYARTLTDNKFDASACSKRVITAFSPQSNIARREQVHDARDKSETHAMNVLLTQSDAARNSNDSSSTTSQPISTSSSSRLTFASPNPNRPTSIPPFRGSLRTVPSSKAPRSTSKIRPTSQWPSSSTRTTNRGDRSFDAQIRGRGDEAAFSEANYDGSVQSGADYYRRDARDRERENER